MATVTEEDQDAARRLYVAIYGHHPLNSNCDATIVNKYAQAIADVRERAIILERVACVEWVRDAEGEGVASDLIAARKAP